MAGLIKADDVAQVKERSSIEDVVREHVTLRSAGPGSLKGLCPFHDEKSPSFTIRPAVGAWHCFGCGEGGDVISFVQKVEHLTFAEAVEVATRAKYGDGPLTRYAADLVIPDAARAECAVLKATAAHFVMFTDERKSFLGGQRAQIQGLVGAYLDQPEARLDPLYRVDFLGAADDGAALRAIVDQVASLSDPRAMVLHKAWC